MQFFVVPAFVRRSFIALTFMGLLLFGNAATSQTLPTLRVFGPGIDGYKAVYYGVKAGIFRKYGLNVVTSLVNNGSAAAAALVGGTADVAFVNALTVFQAHSRNVPMQYIAPAVLLLPNRPATVALVLKESTIRTGRDLNGKTLASSGLHDVNSAVFYDWVDKTGGDWKTMRQIEVPLSVGAAFLQEHRADVVILNEPAVSQALSSDQVRVLVNPFVALDGPVEAAGFAVMAPAVEKNRDLYANFARALHEASVYTNTHLAQTVDLVASYSGATPDVVAHSVRMVDPEYLEIRYLQPLLDVCAKFGLIDKAFPADEIISPAAVKPTR